ncbi:MAG TPA: bifunctional alpha,alpha-trehalose-phosphate synthase (UDP-forming)/trehalose-phosphatase [Sphingobacteriaceae bacterium]
MSKTIIVSNRLPVKVKIEGSELQFAPSEGGLATGLGSVYKQGKNVWIGWPGTEINDAQQQQEVTRELEKKNLLPVFLTQDEINQYYEGFSNEVLWPVFHYMSTYAIYDQSYWQYYKSVNEKFREAVLQVVEPGDVVWVQDYQLLLLPALIREVQPDISIGFFLHIPFPSYELFRLIPWREQLLSGMLGADLIGFHTYDDVRHFISSATRILSASASANVITLNDVTTVIDSFPIGIDYDKYQQLAEDEEVHDQLQMLKSNFPDNRVILSIDRLDYSKGILQRLHAFELLLQDYPEYLEKVVLYMVVVPSRDTVPQYKELHDEIDKLVGNINATYRTQSWHPIHYFYRSFDIHTLVALYRLADVALITPMRDGMNLVCKEYVATRTDNSGVLILSEMAGAAAELHEAVIVNPNDIRSIEDSIVIALNMPLHEQERRMKQLRFIVSKFNVKHWVKIFIDKLHEVKELQASMYARRVNADIERRITEHYQGAARRLILLDYDGTLVGFQNNILQATPDEELMRILERLTANPDNKVVVISGRNYQNLQEWFGHLNLDMIAEHGAWFKTTDGWKNLNGLTDSWKKDIMPVLETYTDRTPGTFIEEKSFSLVWHFRRAEAGLGELRASELLTNLNYLIQDKRLQLLKGNKVIEVKSIEINKGIAALNWVGNQHYDFVMAIGDDHTDEDLFKALNEEAVTIKVGTNVSAARYYVDNHTTVRRILTALENNS